MAVSDCEVVSNRTGLAQNTDLLVWMIAVVGLVLAVGSAFLSFLSYREFTDGLGQPLGDFTAAVLGVMCFAALTFIFTGIAGSLPFLTGRGRSLLFVVLVPISLLVLGVSTWTNLITTAGTSALELYEQSFLALTGPMVGDLEGVVVSIGQLAGQMSTESDHLRAQADCEFSSGCLTGAPGTGALTEALNEAAGLLGETATTLTRASTADPAVMASLKAALEAGDMNAVRAGMASVKGALPFDTLDSVIANMRDGLGIVPNATGDALRAAQEAAITKLNGELRVFATEVEDSVARVRGDLAALVPPTEEPITKAMAVWLYMGQLVPQIALGIAMDWLIIFGAIVVAIARSDLDRMPVARIEPEDL
ncbi:MAG: hypothetical protein AAF317_19690, partial [Pseudomonadota bacterium]